MKTAKGIYRDVKGLVQVGSSFLICITTTIDCYSTLRTKNKELDKITAQSPWLLGIYKVPQYEARLSEPAFYCLEKFRVCPISGCMTFIVRRLAFALSPAC